MRRSPPKNEIMSSFTLPQVIPPVYCKNMGNQTVVEQPLTSIVGKKNTMEVWLPTLFKISSFVFGKGRKLIQVWNNMMVSKLSIP